MKLEWISRDWGHYRNIDQVWSCNAGSISHYKSSKKEEYKTNEYGHTFAGPVFPSFDAAVEYLENRYLQIGLSIIKDFNLEVKNIE